MVTSLLLAFVVASPDAAPGRADLGTCVAMENDVARLACFDAAAAKAGLTRRPTHARLGRWEIDTATSPVDDSKTVVLSLPADQLVHLRAKGARPELHLRCHEHETQAFINIGGFVGSDTVDVTTRVDDLEATTSSWGISTGHDAVFAPRGLDLPDALITAKKYLVRLTPYGEDPILFTFTLGGLADLAPKLFEACPPVEPIGIPCAQDTHCPGNLKCNKSAQKCE